jgi:hypothetical protein
MNSPKNRKWIQVLRKRQNDNYVTMYHMNLINVSECGDMSISGLLFPWASTVDIQLSVLVYYKADLIIISLFDIGQDAILIW